MTLSGRKNLLTFSNPLISMSNGQVRFRYGCIRVNYGRSDAPGLINEIPCYIILPKKNSASPPDVLTGLKSLAGYLSRRTTAWSRQDLRPVT
jgi:hypothetical protein